MIRKFDMTYKKYYILFVILMMFHMTVFANVQSIPLETKNYLSPMSHKLYSRNQLPSNQLLKNVKLQNLSGHFNESSCTGSGANAICVAVGFTNNNGMQYPLLVTSVDGGNTFNVNSTINNFNAGNLLSASCTGSGSTAQCIASGYLGNTQATGTPFIVQSTDGGVTWAPVTVSGIKNVGVIRKVHCTGSAPAICIAVGWGSNTQSTKIYPIVAQSTNGGRTWAQVQVTDLPTDVPGQLYAANCTGDGSNAMCVAVGTYTPYRSTIPLLVQTTNNGATWINKKYLFLSNLNLTFTDVNCNGGNTNTVCTVGGYIGTNDPLFNPVIYRTNDRGETWIRSALENFPITWNGKINAINCAGTGSNAFCITAGAASRKPAASSEKARKLAAFPLIMQSSDNEWTIPTINNASSAWHTLYSATCVSGTNNFCIVSGFGLLNNVKQPILAVSTNKLTAWNAATIANLPVGIFNWSSCTETGSTCIAVGYSPGTQDELLIVGSNNSGATWSVLNVNSNVNCPPPAQNFLEVCDATGKNCVSIGYGDEVVAYYTRHSCDWKPANTYNVWVTAGFNALTCSPDMSNCIAVGTMASGMGSDDATFAYTQDSGATWLGQAVGLGNACSYAGGEWYDASLNAADTTDQQGARWVAVGSCSFPARGLSMIFTNKGRDWAFSATQPATALNKVICNSSMHCKAYDDRGSSYVSNDGGNTWT